ncbi:MAG: HWE histidine kinase domain-containing protein [Hyphomicrobiaceae bacterium]
MAIGERFPERRVAEEVEDRFGLVPNFFCTATAAPGLIDKLWAFAKSAYLDSPLPSLFKERLFVFLSRFCPVRYCIVRHVGFLLGEGRPAGDASARPETIEQVITLLTRPAPCTRELEQALARLEALTGLTKIPAPRTGLETDLFDALTIIFLEPRLSERARNAVRCAFGEQKFEILVAYLAFIRTAHYWTETHPELAYEPDIAAVMQRHPALAALLLDQTEAKRVAQGEAMRQALAELTQAKQALSQNERILAERNAQFALAARAARVGNYAYDVNTDILQISEGYAAIHGLPEGTAATTLSEWRARVHQEDLGRMEGFRDQVFARRQKEYNIEYRIVRSDGEVRWIERRSSVSYSRGGHPERVVGVIIDITERKRVEQLQRALNAELDHRVKNVLATVSATIAQTQEASTSRTDFVTGLNSRINSLARTHELLSESSWRGASLAEIVRREIAPYARGNVEASGPSVTLKPEATQAVATVLHELTTNAAKYGALSNRTGRVSVRWRWAQNGSRDRLVIEWRETSGPAVLAPSRSGYGTTVIRELIPFELGGAVELSFATDGTKCRLEIPGEWTSKGRRNAERSIAHGTNLDAESPAPMPRVHRC